MSADLRAHVTPGSRPARQSWPRALVRMLVVVLPGQLVGMFVAGTVLSASGALRDQPGLSGVMVVAAGLLAGTALGFALRPDKDRLVGYVLAGAGVGVAVFVLLLGLAQLRLPAGSPGASISAFLLGAAVVASVQTAVALPLWWRRSRPGVGRAA